MLDNYGPKLDDLKIYKNALKNKKKPHMIDLKIRKYALYAYVVHTIVGGTI